jgi:hypothetical protein
MLTDITKLRAIGALRSVWSWAIIWNRHYTALQQTGPLPIVYVVVSLVGAGIGTSIHFRSGDLDAGSIWTCVYGFGGLYKRVFDWAKSI